MEDFTQRVLDRVRDLGASYGDVRIAETDTESIHAKNGKVENLGASTSRGFGVRVIKDGAWGFASSSQVTPEEAERVVDLAVRIAGASARTKREDVALAPAEPVRGTYQSDWDKDPFEVPLQEKIDLLMSAESVMRRTDGVRVSEATMDAYRARQTFASTEGSYIEQTKLECGAGITATAVDGTEVQTRSYPAAFGGNWAAAGYEQIEACDLVGNAERIAREAVALLAAPQCPSDERALILDKSMLALQIHESCGHPIELDRVFGTEASYAGTSFLTTDKLGTFRYGSEKVNIVADATCPGGLGTFGYDDEGVPAQRVPIVEEGLFVGYLTSRETAHRIGRTSGGAMRADGWSRIPLIRMTNINLEPGDSSLDEIIAETKKGLYAIDIKSWSIDDKRLNFQFAQEIAYEIEDGSLGRMVRNPTYTGKTPEFWGACDLVAGPKEWVLWGLPNCGKGEPGQCAHVGHGTSAARIAKCRVGVMK
jgi:TldD protein